MPSMIDCWRDDTLLNDNSINLLWEWLRTSPMQGEDCVGHVLAFSFCQEWVLGSSQEQQVEEICDRLVTELTNEVPWLGLIRRR